MQAVRNFIAGEFRPARSGREFDVWDPAVGQVLTTTPESDEPDVDDAVHAAEAAFPA